MKLLKHQLLWKWMFYTVFLGLLPTFIRLGTFAIIDKDFAIWSLPDLVFFNFTMCISVLSFSRFRTLNDWWLKALISLIAIIMVIYTISLLGELNLIPLNYKGAFFFLICITISSFIYSLSVLYRELEGNVV